MARGSRHAAATGSGVARRGHHEDAGRPQGPDRRRQGARVAPLQGGAAPGVVDHVGRQGGVPLGEGVAPLRIWGQHELHALQVEGGVAQVPGQVGAAEPLGLRGDPYAVPAQGQGQGEGAVARRILGPGRAVPGVQPVAVVAGSAAPVGVPQGGVVWVHPAVRLADHDAPAGHSQLPPDPVGADGGDVPGRLDRRGRLAHLVLGRGEQGTQAGAVQHPVHLRPGGEVEPHQGPTVHLQGVHQVEGPVADAEALQVGPEGALGGGGIAGQQVVDGPGPVRAGRGSGRRGRVHLLLQDHEQPVAVEAGLAGQEVDPQGGGRQAGEKDRGGAPGRGPTRPEGKDPQPQPQQQGGAAREHRAGGRPPGQVGEVQQQHQLLGVHQQQGGRHGGEEQRRQRRRAIRFPPGPGQSGRGPRRRSPGAAKRP